MVVVPVAPHLQSGIVTELLNLISSRLLLLEKPVVVNLEQARALEQICAQYPMLTVAVNYIRRYLPDV